MATNTAVLNTPSYLPRHATAAAPSVEATLADLRSAAAGDHDSRAATASAASTHPGVVLDALKSVHSENYGVRARRRTSLDAATVDVLARPLLGVRSPADRASAAGLLANLCRDDEAHTALYTGAEDIDALLDPMVSDILALADAS